MFWSFMRIQKNAKFQTPFRFIYMSVEMKKIDNLQKITPKCPNARFFYVWWPHHRKNQTIPLLSLKCATATVFFFSRQFLFSIFLWTCKNWMCVCVYPFLNKHKYSKHKMRTNLVWNVCVYLCMYIYFSRLLSIRSMCVLLFLLLFIRIKNLICYW